MFRRETGKGCFRNCLPKTESVIEFPVSFARQNAAREGGARERKNKIFEI